jgi:dehydrogenase/reductase SDR family member 12
MPVFRTITRPIIRTPEQGADTIVWLGAASEPLQSSGKFWRDRRVRPTYYLLGAAEDSPQERQKLWDLCQALLLEQCAGIEPDRGYPSHANREASS